MLISVTCFILLLRSTKSATAKLTVIETICFADFEIFHVYLIQIYFESKYLKKLIFGLNTKGFEFIGFHIPLYTLEIDQYSFLGADTDI